MAMVKFKRIKTIHVPLHCFNLARCSLLKAHKIEVAISHPEPNGIIFGKKEWPFATKLHDRTSSSKNLFAFQPGWGLSLLPVESMTTLVLVRPCNSPTETLQQSY